MPRFGSAGLCPWAHFALKYTPAQAAEGLLFPSASVQLSPHLASPCGSSEKAGGGQGARGEDAHQLYVTSAAAPGIGFSLTSASAGSGLRPAQP